MKTKTKKILSKIILSGLIVWSMALSTTLADDFSYVKVVHLNIRASWNHLAKIVATVDKWYKVTILETLDNWWKKVILENGEQGFLNGKYLTDEMPQYAKVDWTRYTIKSWFAFLRWFNMTSKVAVLKKWDILEVTSDKLYLDKWIQVRVVQSELASRYIGRTWYIAKGLVEVVPWFESATSNTGIAQDPAPEEINTNNSSQDLNNEQVPFDLNSAPADPNEVLSSDSGSNDSWSTVDSSTDSSTDSSSDSSSETDSSESN